MKRFTLVIKGNQDEAYGAALKRGVTVNRLGATLTTDSVIQVEADYQTLQDWFCEPPLQPPFPAGALLWFNELKEKP